MTCKKHEERRKSTLLQKVRQNIGAEEFWGRQKRNSHIILGLFQEKIETVRGCFEQNYRKLMNKLKRI